MCAVPNISQYTNYLYSGHSEMNAFKMGNDRLCIHGTTRKDYFTDRLLQENEIKSYEKLDRKSKDRLEWRGHWGIDYEETPQKQHSVLGRCCSQRIWFPDTSYSLAFHHPFKSPRFLSTSLFKTFETTWIRWYWAGGIRVKRVL